jgi:hypothetical protein
MIVGEMASNHPSSIPAITQLNRASATGSSCDNPKKVIVQFLRFDDA